ncbi:MAG: ribonuclease III [Spirochaetes bacterium]|nr:ribonuclease III [Spirochaetota bacterium]
MYSALNSKQRNKILNKFQSRLRINFKNPSLLNRALVHRSYANENLNEIHDNERLEYLGDSVLALIINEYLFKHFENYHEGDLAKIKSAVVAEELLVKIARELDIGEYILLGKGEENSGGRTRDSILANTVEAVIGAMYLDCGLKKTKQFVLSLFKKHIVRIDKLPSLRDPKTTLQEIVQKKYKEKPVYRLIAESGPDHNKQFTVELEINEKKILQASGSSKRKAEIEAAMNTLKLLDQRKISI